MGEEGGGSSSFALDEYLVPRHGTETGVTGGTMPKAAKDKGGLFAEVNRKAADGPGPEKYHKEILEKSFVSHMKGGKFSNKGRDDKRKPVPSPSVGQYAVSAALDTIQQRPRGGIISKVVRSNIFTKNAEKNDIPAPGKYDPKRLEMHMDSPVFSSPRTESRSPKKPSPMGPGYYTPRHEPTEKRVLSYSGSKDDAKTFLDKIMSKKNVGPAPGHLGIPETKWEDRAGKAMHSARLLNDRHVTPRQRGIDGSYSARSA